MSGEPHTGGWKNKPRRKNSARRGGEGGGGGGGKIKCVGGGGRRKMGVAVCRGGAQRRSGERREGDPQSVRGSICGSVRLSRRWEEERREAAGGETQTPPPPPNSTGQGRRRRAAKPLSINFHARIIIGKLEIWRLDSRFVSALMKGRGQGAVGAAQPALRAETHPPRPPSSAGGAPPLWGEKGSFWSPPLWGEKGSVPPPPNSPTQIISSFYFILPMEEERGGGGRRRGGGGWLKSKQRGKNT